MPVENLYPDSEPISLQQYKTAVTALAESGSLRRIKKELDPILADYRPDLEPDDLLQDALLTGLKKAPEGKLKLNGKTDEIIKKQLKSWIYTAYIRTNLKAIASSEVAARRLTYDGNHDASSDKGTFTNLPIAERKQVYDFEPTQTVYKNAEIIATLKIKGLYTDIVTEIKKVLPELTDDELTADNNMFIALLQVYYLRSTLNREAPQQYEALAQIVREEQDTRTKRKRNASDQNKRYIRKKMKEAKATSDDIF